MTQSPRDGLHRVRTEPRPHALALVVAGLVGLALAWVHWLGLIAAGALVALVAPSFRRGVTYGAGIGLLVLVVFTISLGDAAGRVPSMTPIVYVTVGSGLGLPLLGALIRGIV